MLLNLIYLNLIKSTCIVSRGFIFDDEKNDVCVGSKDLKLIEVQIFNLTNDSDVYENSILKFKSLEKVRGLRQNYYYSKALSGSLQDLYFPDSQTVLLRFKILIENTETVRVDSFFHTRNETPSGVMTEHLDFISLKIYEIYLKKICFDLLKYLVRYPSISATSEKTVRLLINGFSEIGKFKPIFFDKIDVRRYLPLAYTNIAKYSRMNLPDHYHPVEDLFSDLNDFIKDVIVDCGDFFFDIRKLEKEVLFSKQFRFDKIREIIMDLYNLHGLIIGRPIRVTNDMSVLNNSYPNVKLFRNCLIITPSEDIRTGLKSSHISISLKTGKPRNRIKFFYDTQEKKIIIPLENLNDFKNSKTDLLIRFKNRPLIPTLVVDVSKFLLN